MRKYSYLIFTATFSLVACTRFISILQPETADVNSTFEVPITVLVDDEIHDYNQKAFFGVRIPTGWEVDDSITFEGVHNGTWIRSDAAADSISSGLEPKEGYYWWAAESEVINTLLQGKVSFTIVIHTNEKVGHFYLDYAVKRLSRILSFGYPLDVGLPKKLVVTNTNDDGEGSLRDALRNISATGEITFDLNYPATIHLDSQLIVKRSLKITGPPGEDLTIAGNGSDRVFFVVPDSGGWKNVEWWDRPTWERNCFPCEPINVEISNVIITDGNAIEEEDAPYNYKYGGGGIYSAFSNLSLNKVVLANNRAEIGGAIHKVYEGNLIISKSTIANNNASEYSIYLTVDDCYCEHKERAIITNSIIWNNTSDEFNEYYPRFVYYSDSRDFIDSEGNIYHQPVFVDTAQGNFRLAPGSPGIDAGVQDLILTYNEGKDTLLIEAMAYQGSAPDMGAYETSETLYSGDQLDNTPQYSSLWNYPNPFQSHTTIQYFLPKREKAYLRIFDASGNEVAVLENRKLEAGEYSYVFEADGLSDGIYFCILETDSGTALVRKIVIAK